MRFPFLSAVLLSACLLSLAVAGPALSQTGRASGIGYTKVAVRRTGILFPRLTRYQDARVMREVNRQIDERTRDFGCEKGSGRGSYFRVRSRVAYADKDIFSIYASAQYYCGGAYPTNDANMSQTYDLRTGKLVKFEELFKNYEADRREILKTIFAAKVAAADRLKASGKLKEDSCEALFLLDNLESSTYNFNFSGNGLQVQPEWPHVIEACAEIVTVPYNKLHRFAAPDGILTRISEK